MKPETRRNLEMFETVLADIDSQLRGREVEIADLFNELGLDSSLFATFWATFAATLSLSAA